MVSQAKNGERARRFSGNCVTLAYAPGSGDGGNPQTRGHPAADGAGYSRLAAADEERTLARLRALDAMADPGFSELEQRIRRHFFTQSTLD